MNLLWYDACSTIIHALISCRLYYCNSIVYNVPRSKTYYPSFEKKLHWLKIQDIIIYTILMLTYKSYYNMAPPYLCELINKTKIM